MMRLLMLVLLFFSFIAKADDCSYSRKIERSIDIPELTSLKVLARAGTLKIIGDKGSDEIRIDAKLCASRKKNLKKMDVLFTNNGQLGILKTDIPDSNGLWFSGTNSIDLSIKVPERMVLDVDDSSGSVLIQDVAALKIVDSSGSLSIKGVAGDLGLRDSSGSIDIDQVAGSVVLSDSSGGISITNVSDDVLIKGDSSGSILVKNVGGDFVVNQDTSGSISAINIGRHFWVRRDSSGGINYKNVGGKVDIPKK